MCGSLLSSLTLASATWRLVWASLNPLSSPSVLWGLCALVSPHPGLPSVTGLVFFQFMGLPSVLHGLCALQGFMYASLLALQACPLHCEVCVGCRGLYAGPLLAPQAHPLCHGASVGFSQFPEPAIWLGLQSVSCFWAEKCSFLCFLPS